MESGMGFPIAQTRNQAKKPAQKRAGFLHAWG